MLRLCAAQCLLVQLVFLGKSGAVRFGSKVYQQSRKAQQAWSWLTTFGVGIGHHLIPTEVVTL